MLPEYHIFGKQNPVSPVVTVGNFDGVHHGHQKIISALLETARRDNRDSVIITLDRHPQKVLHPERELKILTTADEKTELFLEMGVSSVVVLAFTEDTVMLDAGEFYYAFIEGKLGASSIVIGYDHAFGHDRRGNAEFLEKLSPSTGIGVVRVPAELEGERTVSSTWIRAEILSGNVSEALRLLGRPYSLKGRVVRGAGRGRTLGFPTANVDPVDRDKVVPPEGVYAVSVVLESGEVFGGMMSIGSNPTFGCPGRTLEVNIFDFNRDIYGTVLKVEFCGWIRPVRRFSGPSELKEVLAADEIQARSFLQSHGL